MKKVHKSSRLRKGLRFGHGLRNPNDPIPSVEEMVHARAMGFSVLSLGGIHPEGFDVAIQRAINTGWLGAHVSLSPGYWGTKVIIEMAGEYTRSGFTVDIYFDEMIQRWRDSGLTWYDVKEKVWKWIDLASQNGCRMVFGETWPLMFRDHWWKYGAYVMYTGYHRMVKYAPGRYVHAWWSPHQAATINQLALEYGSWLIGGWAYGKVMFGAYGDEYDTLHTALRESQAEYELLYQSIEQKDAEDNHRIPPGLAWELARDFVNSSRPRNWSSSWFRTLFGWRPSVDLAPPEIGTVGMEIEVTK